MQRRLVVVGLCCQFLIPVSISAQTMTAHFIDVGQGDATLLEFSCGAVLIDAGAADDSARDDLIDYLTAFFQRRTDLNDTLESVIVTHPHIDHTRALRRVVETFTVERYLDGGQTTGSGRFGPNWLRGEVANGNRNVTIREILDSAITAGGNTSGLSDGDIDPVACSGIDPAIRMLSGRLTTNPGWTNHEFNDQNNHSLVTRVTFGQASFLFNGDLEEVAIKTMLDYYQSNPSILDVDVYQVGHHGSHNGTTSDLVGAMRPQIAVISMGAWDDGRNSSSPFNTYAYGHPRLITVDTIRLGIDRNRDQRAFVRLGDSPRRFREHELRAAVYGTGWDGTVTVEAAGNGTLTLR